MEKKMAGHWPMRLSAGFLRSGGYLLSNSGKQTSLARAPGNPGGGVRNPESNLNQKGIVRQSLVKKQTGYDKGCKWRIFL